MLAWLAIQMLFYLFFYSIQRISLVSGATVTTRLVSTKDIPNIVQWGRFCYIISNNTRRLNYFQMRQAARHRIMPGPVIGTLLQLVC